MTANTANIFVGAPDRVVGAVMVAPTGTALPTTVSAAPNAAFKDLGYITEDGFSIQQGSDWVTINDWGGDQVRAFLSKFTGTVSFKCLETNTEVLKFAYGDANVTTTDATVSAGTLQTIKLNAVAPVAKSLIANILDDPRKIRIVCPNIQVTSREDLVFTKNAPVTHGLTGACYPDSSGNSIYIYTTDGVFSA
jgi:hypothetical protein